MASKCVFLLLLSVLTVSGQSVESFVKVVEPIANKCREKVPSATAEDLYVVTHRQDLNTYSAKCVQACVYEDLAGDFSSWNSHDAAVRAIGRLFPDNARINDVARATVEKCFDEEFMKKRL